MVSDALKMEGGCVHMHQPSSGGFLIWLFMVFSVSYYLELHNAITSYCKFHFPPANIT